MCPKYIQHLREEKVKEKAENGSSVVVRKYSPCLGFSVPRHKNFPRSSWEARNSWCITGKLGPACIRPGKSFKSVMPDWSPVLAASAREPTIFHVLFSLLWSQRASQELPGGLPTTHQVLRDWIPVVCR